MSLTKPEIEHLETLKKQRSAYKGQLTLFKNKYNDVTTMSMGACESVLHRVRNIYNKYTEIQSKIEVLEVSAIADREAFEDDYGEFESIILNAIHENKKPDPNVSLQGSPRIDITPVAAASPLIEMRMPEIKLPSFSGNEIDWLRFRDIFEELVHNRNIDSSIKFQYLISHVCGGKAYSLIEGIPVTAANYNIAWTTIYNKYNNEIAIQRMYLKQLYDIEPTVSNSSESLQEFIDQAVRNYNSLKALQVPVESWSLILIHHLSEKLDNATKAEVIKGSNDKSVLNFDTLIKILQSRVRVLKALKPLTSSSVQPKLPSNQFRKRSTPSTLMSSIQSCSYCNGTHPIVNCPDFCDSKLTPQMRFQFIKNKRICTNCLTASHNVRNCTNNGCNKCSLRHHPLLHFVFDRQIQPVINSEKLISSANVGRTQSESITNTDPPQDKIDEPSQASPDQQVMLGTLNDPIIPNRNLIHSINSANSTSSNNQIMLGTAVVKAVASNGSHIFGRVLLDSGSHLNFITDKMCRLLKLKMHPTSKQVSGMGNKITSLSHKVYLSLESRCSDYKLNIKCYVIPKITGNLPLLPVNFETSLVPSYIKLADPRFNIPDRIDILIGAEFYHELFTGKSFKLSEELPSFYDSVYGYVISGKLNAHQSSSTSIPCQTSLCSVELLESQVKKFWELENIVLKNNYSAEEKLCEEHFAKNHERQSSGRYSVAIPLNSKIIELGCSNESARRQFFKTEIRLLRNPVIHEQYKNFMDEFIQLNHMELIPDPNIVESQCGKTYYLPHHCVTKDTSTTTKLRVVFNASSKSSSQLSLNDCMMVGPVVQSDLFSIVLRFRKYKIAFSADIAKMYRQIMIHKNQQDLQRVWWRKSQFEPLKCYKLRTVTYGTASAPYLATRTLNQLANDEPAFPRASKVLTEDCYVDDVLTGTDNIEDALKLKQDLISLLKRGGFDLRKFSSNVPELADEDSINHLSLILGILWNTETDNFEMSFAKLDLNKKSDTKRKILSEICQLFDPLGLCAPLILTAKLFMQRLWTVPELKWDDQLPSKFVKPWSEFKEQLVQLNQISIPRCTVNYPYTSLELHGFGDASEAGFGCVFYIRSTGHNGIHKTSLVCSKTRVAPLKKQTIPRLELCAALLLAQMSHKLIGILKITFDFIYLWSDSEVTLLRIRSEPHRYATFVANRISQIQELTSVSSWHYIPTSLNPADHASRGLYPKDFLNSHIWWNGPDFLCKDKGEWPQSENKTLSSELINLDLRKITQPCMATMTCDVDLINKFSSYKKLINVTAYLFRFYNNCKIKRSECRKIGELSANEMAMSLKVIIRIVQSQEFADDIRALKTNKVVSNKSFLKSLSPFLDSDELLRVGGRLKNADIMLDQKYPILLTSKHFFSTLLVRDAHNRLLHAGPQALLYNLRSNYWIISGRGLCKKICSECVRCVHIRPKLTKQIMGDLPRDRVQSSRPFSVVGVDFCGPFVTKHFVRSKTQIKIYICVFICFAVKAVHLEVVQDLSTQAFIACFRRFISRRGMCSKVYSDNATNFVGARSELKELREFFLSESCQTELLKFCACHNMEWLTIPPRSPHFGGLWEAAVKSAKYHLRRAVGTQCLTIDEFNTLVVQIEACLNSRPLTPMSNNPLDMVALSPGHFLIGTPITSFPEPNLLDLSSSRLSRYQLLQQILQQFWKRWQTEYLSELQNRYKWNKPSINVKIGDLVILHDENLPPMYWPLGRVTELHYGSDGRVRVVTVKTAQSIFKRTITKISRLPVET